MDCKQGHLRTEDEGCYGTTTWKCRGISIGGRWGLRNFPGSTAGNYWIYSLLFSVTRNRNWFVKFERRLFSCTSFSSIIWSPFVDYSKQTTCFDYSFWRHRLLVDGSDCPFSSLECSKTERYPSVEEHQPLHEAQGHVALASLPTDIAVSK